MNRTSVMFSTVKEESLMVILAVRFLHKLQVKQAIGRYLIMRRFVFNLRRLDG